MAIKYLSGNRATGTASDRTGMTTYSAKSWIELDRVTLTGTSTTMDTNTFTAEDNLMLLYFGIPAGSYIQAKLQVGNSTIDTGSNYARRHSRDGGTDSTATGGTDMGTFGDGTASANEFGVSDFVNISSQEKLDMTSSMNSNSSGAGNAPHRAEVVGKWANTSNQINRIQLTDLSGSGFASGSEIVVLGYDNDEADSGTNFWQELASVELGSEGDLISSGTITAKKYYMVRVTVLDGSGNSAPALRLGTGGSIDTGNNYAYRYTRDGGSDSTASSQSMIQGQVAPNTSHSNDTYFISNISGQEKLIIGHGSNSEGGASTAPRRTEIVGKWANTAQANVIAIANDDTGDFRVGSHIQVFGAD